MQKKFFFLLMVMMLSFAMPLASMVSTPQGEPIQQQSRDQINVKEEMQIQVRNQLRERLLVKQTDPFENELALQEQARARFNDIEGHWGQEAVARAWAWGLVNGYPDEGFHPNEPVRSVEGLLMIRRLMQKVEGLPSFAPQGNLDMSQIPSWAQEVFKDPLTERFALECGDCGIEPMTRLQFAMTLAFALGLNETMISDGEDVFSDLEALSQEEINALASLRVLGLVAGMNDRFAPEQLLSRAEGAAIMFRVLDLLAAEGVSSN